MSYIQFAPHPFLAPYIDAYWKVTGSEYLVTTQKILPDGCVDIILNMGEDFLNADGGFCLKNESACLVGTMTKFKNSVLLPQTNLIGIRFNPAGFSFFYKFASLHEITDQTIELEKNLAPEIRKYPDNPFSLLDNFFLAKMATAKHGLLEIIESIEIKNGQLSVPMLAEKHCTTTRQLERSFKRFVGITPKEFINIVRFRHALSLLQGKAKNRDLLDIALDCGYYDHAHLGNQIRKYTGDTPSEL